MADPQPVLDAIKTLSESVAANHVSLSDQMSSITKTVSIMQDKLIEQQGKIAEQGKFIEKLANRLSLLVGSQAPSSTASIATVPVVSNASSVRAAPMMASTRTVDQRAPRAASVGGFDRKRRASFDDGSMSVDTEQDATWTARPPSATGSGSNISWQRPASYVEPKTSNQPPGNILRIHGFHQNLYADERKKILEQVLPTITKDDTWKDIQILPGGHLERWALIKFKDGNLAKQFHIKRARNAEWTYKHESGDTNLRLVIPDSGRTKLIAVFSGRACSFLYELKEEGVITDKPTRNRNTGNIYVGRDLVGRIILPAGVTDTLPEGTIPTLALDINHCRRLKIDTAKLQARFKESFLMGESLA